MKDTTNPQLRSVLDRLAQLDKNIVEPVIGSFTGLTHAYVMQPYIGQGRNDLLRIASFKQQFTEHDIG